MKTLSFLFIFLIMSCSKPIELSQNNGIYILTNVKAKIEHAKIIEWDIGKKNEETVAQGVRLNISINEIKKQTKKLLTEHSGVDAFILRVNHYTKGTKQVPGYVLLPFHFIPEGDFDFGLNIYYAAAAVSAQFRDFDCPAYGHRLMIDDVDLTDSNNPPATLYASNAQFFTVSSSKLTDLPIFVDAGSTMIGVFTIDIALYSITRKQFFGQFSPINGQIKIEKEHYLDVISCNGTKEENGALKKDYNPLQNFQKR